MGLKYKSGSINPDVLSGKDKSKNSTQQVSEWRRVVCKSRIKDEIKKFLGDDFVKMGPGKWRSADGARQFRTTPSDYLGKHGMGSPIVPNTPHVHFEFLTPRGANGENFTVSKNVHVPLDCC